ncbi:MAG TPA: ACP S-malonyltransferase [Steroidobacteraceae bacterium]|jgi:[acyl-carrier-protein] S-malonyltransferase|nr:ACP S-malonyltransferase [Steroidobacteraceae bacterium]
MSFALVFPGQGSQSLGMLAALASRFAAVEQCFAEASAVIGQDLWRLLAQGPEERLNVTEITQPVMLAAGIATWRVWREQGGAMPTVVSGHSLGEFTALVCAEALEFAAAVTLVHQRGRLMQQASPAGSGAMAAILGLADAAVEQACREAAEGEVVEAVNFNAPGQVVIAGQAAAVQRAIGRASAHGARRALLLPVSVPAHSSLLAGAAEQLGERLGSISVRTPVCEYISAVDGQAHATPADIRATLVRQLASPVRWTQAVQALLGRTGTLIECGPGRVLTALNRRIAREAQCLALEDPGSLEAALRVVGAPAAAAGGLHA